MSDVKTLQAAIDAANEIRRLRGRLDWLESTAMPHARKQENANGFQKGWHAALSRASEQSEPIDALRALVPEPSADVDDALPWSLSMPVWKCDTCGCLWRDNLDGSVSLFDAQQRSCASCEPSPPQEACSIHWLSMELACSPPRVPESESGKATGSARNSSPPVGLTAQLSELIHEMQHPANRETCITYWAERLEAVREAAAPKDRLIDYRSGYSCGYDDARAGAPMRDEAAGRLFLGMPPAPTIPSHLVGEGEPCSMCGSRIANCECPAEREAAALEVAASESQGEGDSDPALVPLPDAAAIDREVAAPLDETTNEDLTRRDSLLMTETPQPAPTDEDVIRVVPPFQHPGYVIRRAKPRPSHDHDETLALWREQDDVLQQIAALVGDEHVSDAPSVLTAVKACLSDLQQENAALRDNNRQVKALFDERVRLEAGSPALPPYVTPSYSETWPERCKARTPRDFHISARCGLRSGHEGNHTVLSPSCEPWFRKVDPPVLLLPSQKEDEEDLARRERDALTDRREDSRPQTGGSERSKNHRI